MRPPAPLELFLICMVAVNTCCLMPESRASELQERPPRSILTGTRQSLLTDREMTGWRVVGGNATFEWKESTIHGSRPDTTNTFLVSEREYGDFVLEGEVRIESGNSGWQIRSHLHKPINRRSRLYGYQVEVDPSDRSWSGGVYDEGRRGWIHSLSNDQAARDAFKKDAWNHYRIEAIGPRIRTWVNGIPCADVIDLADLSGSIALQVHSGECEVWWRDLEIIDLGTSRYLQTGGWDTTPQGMKGTISEGDPTESEVVDILVLGKNEVARSAHGSSERGLTMRFRYRIDGSSMLQIKRGGDDGTMLEVPFGLDDVMPDRTGALPIVAPGAGLTDLGDEWREVIIDLESGRLVVIDEGRVIARKNGFDPGESEELQVAVVCGSGVVHLDRIRVLAESGLEHQAGE